MRHGVPSFNPRLPGGRRLYLQLQCKPTGEFQSTPSGGKATRCRQCSRSFPQVSIHAFRGEGDDHRPTGAVTHELFQSTPSGGKATLDHHSSCIFRCWFQSTPSGGKATELVARHHYVRDVSIHAFRGEGDYASAPKTYAITSFNPRLPGGRRQERFWWELENAGFNPRLPGGRRHHIATRNMLVGRFQSTPSGGKATRRYGYCGKCKGVSIHAFRGEGDSCNNSCNNK